MRIPPTAAKLREIMHCGQIIQSHALSFFHLSAPDLLLGFDSDPARRNVFGVIEDHPELASDGIALRKFGQQVIEGLAGERIHPSWTVPGGVNAPLDPAVRDRILAGLPEAKATALRTLDFFKGVVDQFSEEIAVFGNAPTMYAGLVDDHDNLQLYDGGLRFVDAAGEIVVDRMPAEDYAQYIGEATVPHSFLKSPYFKPRGFPGGDLPRRAAGAAQRRGPLRHRGGGYRIRRVPPALRQGGAELVPLPLRPPDRDPLFASSGWRCC